MYLHKIYSEPDGLFETVTFKDGINFIFGKKDTVSNPKESLNGIGKSLFLDFLDFCFLSSFDKRRTPRLFKALDLIKDYKVALEFEIERKIYVIKRGFVNPTKDIKFGLLENVKSYSRKELSPILCDLLFKNVSYEGKYSNKWLRKILPFFIKIEKPKKEPFIDPIEYIRESSVLELNQYHLFLMGIDNILAHENYRVQKDLKEIKPVLKGIASLIEETYGLRNIADATNQTNRLNSEIRKLDKVIATFKLADEYKIVEEDANKLTKTIKELWYHNYADRKKLEVYHDSTKRTTDISTIKIRNLYNEVNELLASNVKKSLDEAIKFRKELAISRQEFLREEIKTIELAIKKRTKKIEDLEEKRAKIFTFLSTKKAIRDLSEAYLALSQKREILNELEGKIKLHTDLSIEKAELETESAKIAADIISFLGKINGPKGEFWDVFSEIYDSVYTEDKDESAFSISFNEKKEAKIDIDVTFPSGASKGRNQGRTLIYDLAILFHAIKKNIKCPRFLIHDGIFDGIDKAHFVCLYEFLEHLKTSRRFQYIVTLNQEGTLSERFGHVEKVTPEKISKEAILVLTPTNKLLKHNF
jgi:uncharacterized protein YydD (DUF2326 family)